MVMPFEWDVGVSSKDHAVAASMSIIMTNPATALHHYAGHNLIEIPGLGQTTQAAQRPTST